MKGLRDVRLELFAQPRILKDHELLALIISTSDQKGSSLEGRLAQASRPVFHLPSPFCCDLSTSRPPTFPSSTACPSVRRRERCLQVPPPLSVSAQRRVQRPTVVLENANGECSARQWCLKTREGLYGTLRCLSQPRKASGAP